MKVFVNGQECTDLPGDASAASVLSAVRRSVAKDGLVITEVRLDDVVMDEEAFACVIGGLNAYFIATPVRELVLESLDEAVNYIPRLIKGLEEIAEHFEKSEHAAGESKLSDGAEGLDWLLQVFQKCNSILSVNQDPDTVGLNELQEAMAESIGMIGDFHAGKQYFEMALNIQHKLIPEIEKFSVYVKRLRELGASTQ